MIVVEGRVCGVVDIWLVCCCEADRGTSLVEIGVTGSCPSADVHSVGVSTIIKPF